MQRRTGLSAVIRTGRVCNPISASLGNILVFKLTTDHYNQLEVTLSPLLSSFTASDLIRSPFVLLLFIHRDLKLHLIKFLLDSLLRHCEQNLAIHQIHGMQILFNAATGQQSLGL